MPVICHLAFQRDFHMAVAWGRDTGIFIKITRTLKAEVKEIHMEICPACPRLKMMTNRNLAKEKEGNKLLMSHMLPSFFAFAIGIATSVLVFCLECMVKKCSQQSKTPHRAGRKRAWKVL